MAEKLPRHTITFTVPKPVEVIHKDLVIEVKRRTQKIGTLTISRGSIDWRPEKKHRGGDSESQFHWSEFDAIMQSAWLEKKARRRT